MADTFEPQLSSASITLVKVPHAPVNPYKRVSFPEPHDEIVNNPSEGAAKLYQSEFVSPEKVLAPFPALGPSEKYVPSVTTVALAQSSPAALTELVETVNVTGVLSDQSQKLGVNLD